MVGRHRIAITCPQMADELDRLKDITSAHALDVEVRLPPGQHFKAAEMRDVVSDVSGVIIGDDEIDASVLESASQLRAISKWGIGLDAVDLERASALGVRVTNTPAMFGEEVADMAIGYAIMLTRQLHVIDNAVRQGAWPKCRGHTLAALRMGIVGLGSIGQAVARRAQACGMKVTGVDPSEERRKTAEHTGVRIASLTDTLETTDVLVLCCPLTTDNVHLLSTKEIDLLPSGAWVINVARGPLVDEAALVRALESGHLAGAALDVYEEEPLAFDASLRDIPNVILGAHNGSNTYQGVERTSRQALMNLLTSLGTR